MDVLLQPEILASFLSLTFLEIILGIDNVIFIAILVNNLPKARRHSARVIGLSLAMVIRIILLLGLTTVMSMKEPLLTLFSFPLSGKDLLMFVGGLFLVAKATSSIHEEITHEEKKEIKAYRGSYSAIISQIVFIDIIFSFDSVMTAVGLTQMVWIIVAAMLIAMIVMLFASSTISDFIDTYPTLKMLALAFIMVIGFFLVAEGFGFGVPKGYIYAAMAFSLMVETLNLVAAKKRRLKNK